MRFVKNNNPVLPIQNFFPKGVIKFVIGRFSPKGVMRFVKKNRYNKTGVFLIK